MMRILDKSIYGQIEWYLYNYRYIKRELEQDKEDITTSSPNEIGKFGQGRSRHTDPTALKALKLTSDDILEKEQWRKGELITWRRENEPIPRSFSKL